MLMRFAAGTSAIGGRGHFGDPTSPTYAVAVELVLNVKYFHRSPFHKGRVDLDKIFN